VTPANIDEFMGGAQPKFSAIVDAVDGVEDKVALISRCVELGVPILTTGGAGGKLDATAVRSVDLAFVNQDPLLQAVRRSLRSDRGYPPEVKGPGSRNSVWGVEAISSTEPPFKRPTGWGAASSCDTFGTVTAVTGTFGFAAAGALATLLAVEQPPEGSRYATLRHRISEQGSRPV
jgi:tRNA A37 threonylcarbamoyladenosine dehydratase